MEEQPRQDNWAAFERFCDRHGGAVPSWLAAEYLRMTPAGVFLAARRGWIDFFQHGRNRIYSRHDVIRYRFTVSRKYHDTRPRPPYPPEDDPERLTEKRRFVID